MSSNSSIDSIGSNSFSLSERKSVLHELIESLEKIGAIPMKDVLLRDCGKADE